MSQEEEAFFGGKVDEPEPVVRFLCMMLPILDVQVAAENTTPGAPETADDVATTSTDNTGLC